jgi:hypothetical protein
MFHRRETPLVETGHRGWHGSNFYALHALLAGKGFKGTAIPEKEGVGKEAVFYFTDPQFWKAVGYATWARCGQGNMLARVLLHVRINGPEVKKGRGSDQKIANPQWVTIMEAHVIVAHSRYLHNNESIALPWKPSCEHQALSEADLSTLPDYFELPPTLQALMTRFETDIPWKLPRLSASPADYDHWWPPLWQQCKGQHWGNISLEQIPGKSERERLKRPKPWDTRGSRTFRMCGRISAMLQQHSPQFQKVRPRAKSAAMFRETCQTRTPTTRHRRGGLP